MAKQNNDLKSRLEGIFLEIGDLELIRELRGAETRKRNGYRVIFEQVEGANDFFAGLHSYLNKSEILHIWQDKPQLAEHISRRYETHRYDRGDGIMYCDNQKFYGSLDYENRQRLVNWYNRNMEAEARKCAE